MTKEILDNAMRLMVGTGNLAQFRFIIGSLVSCEDAIRVFSCVRANWRTKGYHRIVLVWMNV